MFLTNLAAAARRRWILVLVGILVSAGMAVGGWYVAKPTYEVTATMLLLPPATTVPEDGNILLQLGGLDFTVGLVASGLSDQSVALKMKELAPSVEFEVTPDATSSSPVVRIQVRDESGSTAMFIRDILVGMVPAELEELQNGAGVNSQNRITATVLVFDEQPEPVGRGKLVGAAVGGLAGIALALAAIAITDGVLLRREAMATPAAVEEGPATGDEAGQPLPTEPPSGSDDATDPSVMEDAKPLAASPALQPAPDGGSTTQWTQKGNRRRERNDARLRSQRLVEGPDRVEAEL